MDLLADVGEGRSGARIDARHSPVADGGEQHRHHRDQDGGGDVAVTALRQHAVARHRRHRLDDDDAVKDEIAEGERALEARRSA
jgi:hypothetical protein